MSPNMVCRQREVFVPDRINSIVLTFKVDFRRIEFYTIAE